jgi:hypothetical protein
MLCLFSRWMPTWGWRGHCGADPGFLLESPSRRSSATGRPSTMPPSAAGGLALFPRVAVRYMTALARVRLRRARSEPTGYCPCGSGECVMPHIGRRL